MVERKVRFNFHNDGGNDSLFLKIRENMWLEDYWQLARRKVFLCHDAKRGYLETDSSSDGVSSMPIGACPINIFAVRATLEIISQPVNEPVSKSVYNLREFSYLRNQ